MSVYKLTKGIRINHFGVILGLNSESEPSEKYIRPVLNFEVNQFWKTMRRSRENHIVLESMLEELKGNEN